MTSVRYCSSVDWIRDHGWQTWLIASLLLAGAEMTTLDLSLLMMAVGAGAGCVPAALGLNVVFQVLVAGGLTKGRTVTGHPHVCVEVERAGGIYSEKPAVRDGRLITAQSWKSHPEFYREVLSCLGA